VKGYELLRDVLGVGGIALAGTGLWTIHPGAAMAAAGLLLVGVAVFVMRRG